MEKKTKVFDKNDLEMVDLLAEMGFTPDEAKAMLCIVQSGKPIYSKDVELIADMRQPCVSTAIRELSKHGFVKTKDEKKTTGKGRPLKCFWATIKLTDLVDQLIKKKTKEMEGMQQKMARLRQLSEKISC